HDLIDDTAPVEVVVVHQRHLVRALNQGKAVAAAVTGKLIVTQADRRNFRSGGVQAQGAGRAVDLCRLQNPADMAGVPIAQGGQLIFIIAIGAVSLWRGGGPGVRTGWRGRLSRVDRVELAQASLMIILKLAVVGTADQQQAEAANRQSIQATVHGRLLRRYDYLSMMMPWPGLQASGQQSTQAAAF